MTPDFSEKKPTTQLLATKLTVTTSPNGVITTPMSSMALRPCLFGFTDGGIFLSLFNVVSQSKNKIKMQLDVEVSRPAFVRAQL